MQAEPFAAAVRAGARTLGVAVERDQLEHLYAYFRELRRWNAKINLVARDTSDEEVIDRHFLDSLAVLSLFDEQPGRLLDVGSGAGFPGLIVKIMRPSFGVDLLEPRLKRVSFLRHVVRTLDLADIEIHAERLEPNRPPPGNNNYNWVTGRAVTSIGEFLSWCGHFHATGCRILFMKGPRYEEEMEALGRLSLPWVLVKEKKYRLPGCGAERVLLVFRGAREYL
jgi:16S rRNA (guanine527-N7)-methyltransferase